MNPFRHTHTARTILLALGCMSACARATDLHALDDAALSEVRGRDGVSFAIGLNANVGNVTLGVSDPASGPASIGLNNVTVSGVVAGTLDLTGATSGSPAFVSWAFPNVGLSNTLQFGFDLLVTANGTSLGSGVQLQNVALTGSGMQLTPNPQGGVTFGAALNLGIGNILLQPNGRGVTNGQLDISGVVIGAAGSNGSAPWILANINSQPGVLNVVTDAGGTPNLQWGTGWPSTPGSAPAGSLQVGNITFTTPEGNVNLGSSSIGSMQIQYLNVRFKS